MRSTHLSGEPRSSHSLARIGASLIRGYQYFISPLLGRNCRFYPSCSEYCKESLLRFGFVRGSYLGVRRCLKCHPFHEGGIDPVPEASIKTKTGEVS